MIGKLIIKNKVVLFYGASLATLMFLLKWLEFRFLIIGRAFEIYIGAIAVIFTLLGIWLALKLSEPKIKTVVIEKDIPFKPHDGPEPSLNGFNKPGLSRRELEVLQLMAEGLSNQEIAHRLFVSLNTIKTHSSKVFEKLDVKRRTQAIDKARRLTLIN